MIGQLECQAFVGYRVIAKSLVEARSVMLSRHFGGNLTLETCTNGRRRDARFSGLTVAHGVLGERIGLLSTLHTHVPDLRLSSPVPSRLGITQFSASP
jgi:hypothetical protein